MEVARGEGAGFLPADPRRNMATLRAACDRRIEHGRERNAAAASAFHDALLSARALAEQNVAHREKLNRLKDQLRGVEAGLAEALSTVEALEANFDAAGKMNLDEAIMWYRKFLGFQVFAGEGVKFVFNKVDMQSPDNEYFFCIKVNKDEYSLIQCVPLLKDFEELVKDLNCTNDLYKFVRIMRSRFQAAASKVTHPASSLCTETSSTMISSPPALSVYTTSESTTNQSRSQNKDIRAKRGARSQSTRSPAKTPSSTRRSPRFVAVDSGNRC